MKADVAGEITIRPFKLRTPTKIIVLAKIHAYHTSVYNFNVISVI